MRLTGFTAAVEDGTDDHRYFKQNRQLSVALRPVAALQDAHGARSAVLGARQGICGSGVLRCGDVGSSGGGATMMTFEVFKSTREQRNALRERGFEVERMGDDFTNVTVADKQADELTDWLDAQRLEHRLV